MLPDLNRRNFLLAAASTALVAGIPPLRAASSGWRSAPSLPLAVQEIYPNVLNGRIYLAGGIYAEGGQARGATARHFSWAPGEVAWSEKAPLPKPRHHPNIVGAGGKIYALGGFDVGSAPMAWTMTGETLIYDPATDAWSEGPAAPEPHGETVCVAVGQHIHVIGGRTPKGEANMRWTDHVDSDRHFFLDTQSGTWEQAAPALVKRNSAAGALVGGSVHVVGGRQVGGGNLVNHEVYDKREDRWRTAAPMPQGQGGLAAAAVDGRLYAFGGEYFGGDGGVYPEAWAYSSQTDTWAAIEDMPTPRHGLGAVTLGGDIYAIGGAEAVSGNQTSTVMEAYRP